MLLQLLHWQVQYLKYHMRRLYTGKYILRMPSQIQDHNRYWLHQIAHHHSALPALPVLPRLKKPLIQALYYRTMLSFPRKAALHIFSHLHSMPVSLHLRNHCLYTIPVELLRQGLHLHNLQAGHLEYLPLHPVPKHSLLPVQTAERMETDEVLLPHNRSFLPIHLHIFEVYLLLHSYLSK